MKTVELEQVCGSVAEYAEAVGDEPLILTLHGEPCAAIIPYRTLVETHVMEEYDERELIPEEGESLTAYLTRVKAQYHAIGGLPFEQVKEELGIDS